MTAQYLVRDRLGHWHVARPGVMPHDIRTTEQSPALPIDEQPLRLAWFDRDTHIFLMFDFEEPEVKRLPD